MCPDGMGTVRALRLGSDRRTTALRPRRDSISRSAAESDKRPGLLVHAMLPTGAKGNVVGPKAQSHAWASAIR